MASVGLETQPGATTYDLEDLVGNAWQGRVRVPHFQRGFRWGSQDVLRLFDSVVKGYPIGSLLLWVRRSPAQRLTLGRLAVDAPAFEEALWVVDGQQRIISLANALHPGAHQEAPFNVCYDLAERVFTTQPKIIEPRQIPLHVLFDLEALIGWFADEGRQDMAYFKEAQRVAKALRQFKVPAYLVKQDDERVLTDIFDRMNNYGKRLSRAEIFSALFAGPEEGADHRLSLSRIADQVAERTGFGVIDTDTILSSVLARRGPDPSRDIRNEFASQGRRTVSEFPMEDRDTAYREGREALVRAVEFLQSDAGVPHLAFLAYRAPLVVLTRFFAHFPEPSMNSRRLLRRLYWRVAVSGPALFKGSFTQLGRALSAKIVPGEEHGSVKGLMAAMAEAKPSMPNPDRFKTNEATAKMVLSAWWSLAPRSLLTGKPFDLMDLGVTLGEQSTAATVAYRIFPRGLDTRRQLLAASRILLPTGTEPVDAVPDLLVRRPPEVAEPDWAQVLESHLVDDDMVEALRDGNINTFLTLRQQAIVRQLRGFLYRMAEWKYEDTPSLDSMDLDGLDELEDSEDGGGPDDQRGSAGPRPPAGPDDRDGTGRR